MNISYLTILHLLKFEWLKMKILSSGKQYTFFLGNQKAAMDFKKKLSQF